MTTEVMAAVSRRPSERMLEIQRMVMVEGRSTFNVAELLQLSQQKVCDIVEQCLAWMAEVLPALEAQLPREGRLALAEQVAAMRLDNLHREAMRAWRASQGEWYQRQHRRGATSAVQTTTVRRAQGDIRYLAAAMHIVIKMAKLPFAAIPLAGVGHSPDIETPSVRDCSADEPEQAAEPAAPEAVESVTSYPSDTCDAASQPQPAENEPQLSVFTPVQPDLSAMINRDDPAPAFGRPRNRHERRARQKMLERHLRKAK